MAIGDAKNLISLASNRETAITMQQKCNADYPVQRVVCTAYIGRISDDQVYCMRLPHHRRLSHSAGRTMPSNKQLSKLVYSRSN